MISFIMPLSNIIFCDVSRIFVLLRHEMGNAGRKMFSQLSIPVKGILGLFFFHIFCGYKLCRKRN